MEDEILEEILGNGTQFWFKDNPACAVLASFSSQKVGGTFLLLCLRSSSGYSFPPRSGGALHCTCQHVDGSRHGGDLIGVNPLVPVGRPT